MTNGINNVSGYGNYGLGGYMPQKKEETANENPTPVVANNQETQVDPAKVMDFLAANNYFIAPMETTAVPEADEATRANVENYMENFEMIMGVIIEEFGEELAPYVMDVAMDYLMDLAA